MLDTSEINFVIVLRDGLDQVKFKFPIHRILGDQYIVTKYSCMMLGMKLQFLHITRHDTDSRSVLDELG